MIKINIIGSFFGIDGYSSHTRQLANALNNLDEVEVKISTNLIKGWHLQCNDKELEMVKRSSDNCNVNLMIGTPNSWLPYLCENKLFIGFCVWEGDKIPEGWIEILIDERVNQIWVPSNHTKDAIINTCADTSISEKIKLVPHGVDSNLFYPLNEEKEKFTFVMNKGFRGVQDRGGIQYGLKAYLEEFKSDDKVSMLVKINPAYGIPDIQSIITQLNIQNKDLPELKFNIENLAYKDLNKLYNKGHVFVAPARAEAFNIPCIEAMACGLPVIATDFGGQTDYVEDKYNGLLIDYKLDDVKHEIAYENCKWATPDIEDLKNKLRWCYNNQNKIKEMGKNGINTSKNWLWEITAQKAKKCLYS